MAWRSNPRDNAQAPARIMRMRTFPSRNLAMDCKTINKSYCYEELGKFSRPEKCALISCYVFIGFKWIHRFLVIQSARAFLEVWSHMNQGLNKVSVHGRQVLLPDSISRICILWSVSLFIFKKWCIWILLWWKYDHKKKWGKFTVLLWLLNVFLCVVVHFSGPPPEKVNPISILKGLKLRPKQDNPKDTIQAVLIVVTVIFAYIALIIFFTRMGDRNLKKKRTNS